MKFKVHFLINLVLAFTVASLVVAFSGSSLLKRVELAGIDFLFRTRTTTPVDKNIVIIEITDEDIAHVGRWPWARTWHAAMVKALNSMGAQTIYFDMLFSEPSQDTASDDVFAQAMRQAGNVYLPFAFFQRESDEKHVLRPIEAFAAVNKGDGFINIYPDLDGTLRRLPLIFKTPQGYQPHMALKLAMDQGDLAIDRLEPHELVLKKKDATAVRIPLIDAQSLLVNWRGKWQETFVHYSYVDILKAYKDLKESRVPSIDIAPIQGSTCLVALTALGLFDIKPVPVEAEYPSVGVIATTMSNILHREFIISMPLWVNWLLIYLLAMMPPFLISEERPLREILSAVLMVVFVVAVLWLFKRDILLSFSLPLLALAASYVVVATYNFTRISVERVRFMNLAITDDLTGLYNIRYFKMMMKADMMMARIDPEKCFCIIMGDLDHFKNVNDAYGHQAGDLVLRQVARALKAMLRTSDVIARYGGEEFIIMLHTGRLEQAMDIAEKLRRAVEVHSIKDENEKIYKATVSFGVAFMRDNDTEDTLIKRADEGLYKAKSKGRNRVETVERARNS